MRSWTVVLAACVAGMSLSVPSTCLGANLVERLLAAQGRGEPARAGAAPGASSPFFPNASSATLPAASPPLPGPRPYYGQALGATYYNWGYFGARQHAQYWRHTGYYNDYREFGQNKGY